MQSHTSGACSATKQSVLWRLDKGATVSCNQVLFITAAAPSTCILSPCAAVNLVWCFPSLAAIAVCMQEHRDEGGGG